MADVGDKVSDDVARIQGLAWALEHRLELEATLKSDCKAEVLRFATSVLISALLIFGGAGYVILKAMVVSEVNGANAVFEDKFKGRFDSLMERDQARFDWKRYHDYGKMYTYLADLIALSPLPEDTRRERLERALDRAVNYFEDAAQQDNAQASTYFELGELWYRSAHDYGVEKYHNTQKALDYYGIAAKRYTATEVGKGWRADAYKRIAEITTDLALDDGSPIERVKLRDEAVAYLARAREEYEAANTGDLKRVQASLAELTEYSTKLRSSANAAAATR